jgi:hypothetical protein
MAEPGGAVLASAFETIVSGTGDERYEILYLPDLRNPELQDEGKPPTYYWLPKGVRIARKGDTGDYKFHLLHFVGVQSEETTVGVSGTQEITGGVLSVTVTAAPPLVALENSHKQLSAKLRSDDRKYWSWHVPIDPQFAPMIISDSRTHMSSLSPRLDGSIPAETPNPSGQPGPAPGAGAPGTRSPAVRQMLPRLVRGPRTVRAGRDATPSSNLDAWYERIEGQGPGSIDPAGENAFTALCGSLVTAILVQGFHGAYSPVSVSQTLGLKVWSENLRIKIDGNWDRIFAHFSEAAQVRNWWWDADIKAEFNNLRINGGITVEVEIDGTNPGADKMREEVDKRIDLIVQKFTEQAKTRIFDPAPPEVKPAEVSGSKLGGLFGLSGGFTLRYRRDETQLALHYDETRQERFNLPTTISSTLEGFYADIKKDPDAEKKYFTTLFLEDFNRKITHHIKPVVNYPEPSREWVGDPVAFLGVQVGYPSASGDRQWQSHVFQSTDTGAATTWSPAVTKKSVSDVTNPPSGWTPDISYIKRSIHFTEPPSETANPYVHCFVEKDEVALDPEPDGLATNDLVLEVRADSVGKLDVGPISLNVSLETSAQMVEVEFQCHGQTDAGNDRTITKFIWHFNDQDRDRYWTIFTGQKDFQPSFRYRCHVVVKGSILTKGLEWTGPWTEGAGNGPLVISVPTPEDAGVQTRSLVPTSRPATTVPPASSTAGTPAGRPTAPAASAAGRPRTVPLPTAVPAGRPADGDGGRDRTVSGYEITAGADHRAGDGGNGNGAAKNDRPDADRDAPKTRPDAADQPDEPPAAAPGWTTIPPATVRG